ncbi:MAG TPA: GNAT family N-acetyltransferase [Dehalococcoidia bacterium]|nr:GNAT family N-acetyltransferase [Dehalococcoidia bacterium]
MTSTELACETVAVTELQAIQNDWKRLYEETSGARPFSLPIWYSTWLAHFPAPGAVFLELRRDHQLVGIIPLLVKNETAAGLGNLKIQDYSGNLMAPGDEVGVAQSTLGWLVHNNVSSLTLWGQPEGSPEIDAWSSAAASAGWALQLEDEAVAPVAALPSDWESFVAVLPKKDRHELRRKLRNLEAAGAIELESVSDMEDVDRAMDTLLGMMRESHEGKTRFLTVEMEAFFREMAPAMAQAGLGRIWQLRLDGKPIAVLLGFEDKTTRYLYNSGYDPAHGRLAVGLLSKALALRGAIEAGLRSFDFLRGEEDYKRRLGGVARNIKRLTLTRESD